MSSSDSVICYAANAMSGIGGQGEFLRHMVYTLDRVPQGRVLSRKATAARAHCVDIPFAGWRRTAFDTIQRLPVVRGRRDWLTLLSDVEFDTQVQQQVGDAALFDGVMGQCDRTLQRLKSSTPSVVTALNTHLDHLARVLSEEHRRLGIGGSTFVSPLMRARASREIARATRIRAISDEVKRSFVAEGVAPDRVDVVLPAVDLDHFKPVAKRDETFRLLAVLTIDPRKGAYYLLKAFERAAIPGSELVIIGATGDRWSNQMLREFQGRLPNLRVQSANVMTTPIEQTFGPASVCVHPAIEDGFALAVSQALACGKPVITTRQTGASQLIRDGHNGYVLECRDVDGLVDRFRLLAGNPSALERMSVAAAQSVAHLGYPQSAANVLRLYDELRR